MRERSLLGRDCQIGERHGVSLAGRSEQRARQMILLARSEVRKRESQRRQRIQELLVVECHQEAIDADQQLAVALRFFARKCEHTP